MSITNRLSHAAPDLSHLVARAGAEATEAATATEPARAGSQHQSHSTEGGTSSKGEPTTSSERTDMTSHTQNTQSQTPRPHRSPAQSQPQTRQHTRVDTTFDHFHGLYATRTLSMKSSPVRALFAVANRPEVVSLAGGMPNISDLPLDVVGDALKHLVETRGAQAMQYGSGQGEPEIREGICRVMAVEGVHADPDDVTVTCGSQQALDLVSRIFCNPGDVVMAESPSYVGALNTFASYQAEVIQVGMDEDGLDPEDLRVQVSAARRAGKKVKFLYTIPNHSNPSGISQTVERRHALVEEARRLDLLVVEDNPYGLLNLDGDPLPTLREMSPDNVIYLGSFSKTFAPGFRVGWALAPAFVRERLVLAQESATLCPPVFSQFAVATYLESWDWRKQVRVFIDMYRQRRDAMLEALEEQMPAGTTWTHPSGGFFVWVTMPDGLDSAAMLPRAVTELVAYTPGTAFYSDGRGQQNMRLSFCYPTPERIKLGVERLAGVMRRELEIRETFGVGPSAAGGARDYGPGPNSL
ncbi:aminotransferase-like domain-containing protein [Acidipropionibacterium jensenii]|uniref:aminotransferase-like domain-containing protein n=1 Tax=Acidipropionibacterium jensenii TaxID=1749 RepID=UPI00214B49C6